MSRNEVDIADSIKARWLQVRLADAVTFQRHDPASAALERLAAANFDHAPVLQADRAIGFVRREDLQRPGIRWVGEVQAPIGPGLLVSADATVGDLLGGLAAAPFVFVLEGRDISGFVTPSDLNKQPSRSYFFLLLAELELGLTEIVGRKVGADQALALLPEARQQQIRQFGERARKANLESEWITYFVLGDLLQVVKNSPDTLALLGYRAPQSWEKKTREFAQVRNAVVHAVRDLVDARHSPAHLERVDKDLRHVVDRTRLALEALGRRRPKP